MGTRGPIPKRAVQRRRRNIVPDATVIVEKNAKLWGPALGSEEKDAHPLMRDWYGALRKSGQGEFLEPSDWAQARFWVHVLSGSLANPKGPSAMLIAAWTSDCVNLLTTEGSRRRMRMELERSKPVDADKQRASGTVVDLRRRLAGG